MADSQVEFSRVAEQHVQETSRTARALADQVARTASEETQESIRKQQDNLQNFRDPFQSGERDKNVVHASGNLQSASEGLDGSTRADVSGKSAQSGQQNVQAQQSSVKNR